MKGFTLIELLIVIAVLAVLSTAVVLVLNPAEILRQSRDSTRLSDLSAINNAISLFLTDVSTTTWVTTPYCTATTTGLPGGGSCTMNATTTVNGLGWVPINFGAISVGSPLSKLPIDPLNGAAANGAACSGAVSGCFYVFKPSSTSGTGFGHYKLMANLESGKYIPKGATDGGVVPDWYEFGSDLSF
ncbi:MAG: type II secretion system protein [Patescibacteria group bacterium]